jgi:hypothetical protein
MSGFFANQLPLRQDIGNSGFEPGHLKGNSDALRMGLHCFTLNPQKSTALPVLQVVYRLFMRHSLW